MKFKIMFRPIYYIYTIYNIVYNATEWNTNILLSIDTYLYLSLDLYIYIYGVYIIYYIYNYVLLMLYVLFVLCFIKTTQQRPALSKTYTYYFNVSPSRTPSKYNRLACSSLVTESIFLL